MKSDSTYAKALEGYIQCDIHNMWDAHFPAAILATELFLEKHSVSKESEILIEKQIGAIVRSKPDLFSTVRISENDSTTSESILAKELLNDLKSFRQVEFGHHTIHAALILEALRREPDFLRTGYIRHLMSLISKYKNSIPRYWLHLEPEHRPTDFFIDKLNVFDHDMSNQEIARIVLVEVLGHGPLYQQMGSIAHTGHILAQANSLIQLDNLGYRAIRDEGLFGLEAHIILTRDSIGKSAPENSSWTPTVRAAHKWTEPEFWQQDFLKNSWNDGHVMKWGYATYELLRVADDPELKEPAEELLRHLTNPCHTAIETEETLTPH
ncbi:hypothetical protein MLD52_17230 [Puniceicoccaceae bacterium K14]|nr:hypothetical protein [Puniceicoccaceae bacterium K14]